VAVSLGDPEGTVLVLRALGLGDLLTGIPALRGLRGAFPHARIVLATRPEMAPLALFSGVADDVLPTAGLGELRWAGVPPELAVNLHGRGPQSIADLLSTNPKHLITHRNPAYPDIEGPPWRAELHEVDRWSALLGAAGVACNADDLGIGRPAGYPYRRDAVVIHPGAAFPARRWPPERFAAVAEALHSAGHQILITGSPAESDLASSVAAQAGLDESAIAAGKLDILGLVALISDCRLLICGDTGVGHIATATGTPSVLLFGPTPPSRWGPRGRGRHITVWAGDRGDPHGDKPHRGLLMITPSRVLEATSQLLSEAA
jgi:ADP-heptose:LPS heptosyltransferase